MIIIEAYRIGRGFWIESAYGMKYCSRIVKSFRIFTGKRKKNDNGRVSLFRMVTVFWTYYRCRIVKAFGIFIEKRMVNDSWMEYVYRIV